MYESPLKSTEGGVIMYWSPLKSTEGGVKMYWSPLKSIIDRDVKNLRKIYWSPLKSTERGVKETLNNIVMLHSMYIIVESVLPNVTKVKVD